MLTIPRLGRAPAGRARKTKNFLNLKKSAGGAGGSRKKLKGNFMVLLSALPSYEKGFEIYYGVVVDTQSPFSPSLAPTRGATPVVA